MEAVEGVDWTRAGRTVWTHPQGVTHDCTNRGTDLSRVVNKPATVPSRPDRVQERRLTFGDAVRERRLAAGLTQEQLAERAGVDRKSISRMETGAYSPSLDRVWRVADALQITLSDFFGEPTSGTKRKAASS